MLASVGCGGFLTQASLGCIIRHKMADQESMQATGILQEIYTSPLNLSLLFLCIFLLYKIFRGDKPAEMGEVEAPLPKLKKRDFTLSELQEYDGATNPRILMAVNGKVFDVTRGKKFYGPGEVSYDWYNFIILRCRCFQFSYDALLPTYTVVRRVPVLHNLMHVIFKGCGLKFLSLFFWTTHQNVISECVEFGNFDILPIATPPITLCTGGQSSVRRLSALLPDRVTSHLFTL